MKTLKEQIKALKLALNEALRIEINPYVRSHAKKPRGYGRWAFAFDSEDAEPYFSTGSFTTALADAKKLAMIRGYSTVYVLP